MGTGPAPAGPQIRPTDGHGSFLRALASQFMVHPVIIGALSVGQLEGEAGWKTGRAALWRGPLWIRGNRDDSIAPLHPRPFYASALDA